MKNLLGYIRAILLSIVVALAIDAITNYEDYKQGWAANFSGKKFFEKTKTAHPSDSEKTIGA
ncbi:MAG TPA: hypothetical protein PL009_06200 [Flavipsychrobacter sp.]|mgnify:CR=1 FL=1|nr:hypothetical protein [Flavipsychrobacter sp.]